MNRVPAAEFLIDWCYVIEKQQKLQIEYIYGVLTEISIPLDFYSGLKR